MIDRINKEQIEGLISEKYGNAQCFNWTKDGVFFEHENKRALDEQVRKLSELIVRQNICIIEQKSAIETLKDTIRVVAKG